MDSHDCPFDRYFDKPVLGYRKPGPPFRYHCYHFEGAQIYNATKGKFKKLRLEKWIELNSHINHSRIITVIACNRCTGSMQKHKLRFVFYLDGSTFTAILRRIIRYIEDPEISKQMNL